uniref:Secreted protein n=1 Tax=Setaria viridis TaxID=4556 RepID=A0A4U6U1S9_SETVI|nr:hypothetical protein SEVIR_6G010425v2 [Setaria viridis]
MLGCCTSCFFPHLLCCLVCELSFFLFKTIGSSSSASFKKEESVGSELLFRSTSISTKEPSAER